MGVMAKIGRFARLPFTNKLNRLHRDWRRVLGLLYHRHIFGSFGSGSILYRPVFMSYPEHIYIGNRVSIRPGARLETVVLDPAHPPRLTIGNQVNIEQNVHLVCSSRITIGDRVSITGNCSIVDTVHPFEDVDNPIKIGYRIDPTPTPVEIGEGSFIGMGTMILPNVRIGKNCVIGANSTVTRSIPDYSVASGSPARVIRRYDWARKEWIKVPNGEKMFCD